jgi:hypothetical protein
MSEPLFKERQDGLLEYCGDTKLDAVISTWRQIDTSIDRGFWTQAAIAASITPVYGQDDTGKLAEAIEKSPAYVRRMAKTYRHFTENDTWVSDLSFKHHSIAMRHPNPSEALLMALEHGWSCAKTEEWIINQAVENSATKKAVKKQRENEFRAFLERVDGIILNDFMETCPNADWGRRVFKNWREDVTWELSQIARTEAVDRVQDAINEGAVTVPDIKAKTGLSTREIEAIVGAKVAEGIWELVREGGETDVARGTRRMIIHVVGEGVFV